MKKHELDKILVSWGSLILPITELQDGDDVFFKQADASLLARMPTELDEVDEYWFCGEQPGVIYKAEEFCFRNLSLTLGSLLAEVKSTIKYVVRFQQYHMLTSQGFCRQLTIYSHPDWVSLIDTAS